MHALKLSLVVIFEIFYDIMCCYPIINCFGGLGLCPGFKLYVLKPSSAQTLIAKATKYITFDQWGSVCRTTCA